MHVVTDIHIMRALMSKIPYSFY